MDESQRQNTHADEIRPETCCPFCLVMKALAGTKRKYSECYTHLLNAQIELLQAFKSFIDQQILSLESRKSAAADPRKASKIEVE